MTRLRDATASQLSSSAADRLRMTMAAVRLSFTWFGTRRSLSQEQREQAADTFGAEGNYLSAAKKLLDTHHPAFKAVTAVRGRAISFWRGISLPYPEPGIRLIRQTDMSIFDVQMTTIKAELEEALTQLNEHYGELKSAARERLGRLFNAGDYPESLLGLFSLEHDFPSVEAPQYLRQLSPELYRQEQQRVAARFEEAVRLAEEGFLQEFGKLVSHLSERLQGSDDGKPKVFRDSAVENLGEFFARFRSLDIGSHEQLDALVEQAQRAVRGLEPQQLRNSQQLREQVALQLSAVQTAMSNLMVERPRRQILRRRQEQAA